MGEGPEGIVQGFSLMLPLFSWSRGALGPDRGAEPGFPSSPAPSRMAAGLSRGEAGGFLPRPYHSFAGTLPACPVSELNPKSSPACAAGSSQYQAFPSTSFHGSELPQPHTCPWATALRLARGCPAPTTPRLQVQPGSGCVWPGHLIPTRLRAWHLADLNQQLPYRKG